MIKFPDKLSLGILLGLLGPFLALMGFYVVKFSSIPFVEFLKTAFDKGMLSPLLSLCAIVNLGLFYLLLQTNRLYAARGVILSTIVIGFVIVMLKFVL